MSELPKYVQAMCSQLLASIQFAEVSELEAVRKFLVDAAKSTIEIEMYKKFLETEKTKPILR